MNISFTYSDAYNIVLGMLVMMLWYSIVGYVQNRRREHIYYGVYVILQYLFLFQLKNDILAHQPIEETWQLAMTRPFVIIFYNLFAIEILELPTKHARAYRFARYNIRIGLVIAAIMAYFCIQGQPEVARSVIENGKIIIFILGLFVIFGIIRHGSTTERYFVIGSILLIAFESTNIFISKTCHTLEGAAALQHLSPDSLLAYPNFFSKIGITLDLLCLNICLIHRNRQVMLRSLEAEFRQCRALENERLRIAQDMHDEFGSSLSALQMLSANLVATATTANDNISKNIARIANLSTDLAQRLREVIWTISIEQDTLESLTDFVRRYADDLAEAHNLSLHFHAETPAENIALSGEQRRALWLTIKETLNNTIKHAKATQIFIDISLTPTPHALSVRISDDGIGFNADEMLRKGGHGLRNIMNRIKKINATVSIQTLDGHACTTIFLALTSKKKI